MEWTRNGRSRPCSCLCVSAYLMQEPKELSNVFDVSAVVSELARLISNKFVFS
jgi:hypothetical protein